MELHGRVALVTGAGHRVGRAIALALGARGMRVAVHYNAAADGARETVEQIQSAGGDAQAIAADLTHADAAFETWPGYVPHGISKSGVVHLTRSLARVMAPEVRVAGIAPGTVLLPDNWDEASAEHLRATTPLERSGSPADVTSTVLFILDS